MTDLPETVTACGLQLTRHGLRYYDESEFLDATWDVRYAHRSPIDDEDEWTVTLTLDLPITIAMPALAEEPNPVIAVAGHAATFDLALLRAEARMRNTLRAFAQVLAWAKETK